MKARDRREFGTARQVHPLSWVWESLECDPTLVVRAMFGAKAVYLGGQMMFCCCSGDEPWNGLLVCTDRAHHEELMRQFPMLRPHAILGKWLYLPESSPHFEALALRIAGLARAGDARIGIIPGTRGGRRAAAGRRRRSAGSSSPRK